MVELLNLEDLIEMIARSYEKKKKGWEVVRKTVENNLFDFIIKGPDIVTEVIQDDPFLVPIVDGIRNLPRPWRPVGKAAILDEDPTKINFGSYPYGFRPVDRKTFEGMMRTIEMMHRQLPKEEVMGHYERVNRQHFKSPVVGYGEISVPIMSIGPFDYRPNLMDISEKQRELRAKLITETRRMQRRGYVV